MTACAPTAVDDSTPVVASSSGSAVDPEEARRADRQAERQAREEATRFNFELGRALLTLLSRVRGDERVLNLLACGERAAVHSPADAGDVAGRREWDAGRNDRLPGYGAVRAADDSVAFEAADFGGGHSEQIREHGFAVLAELGRPPDGSPWDG